MKGRGTMANKEKLKSGFSVIGSGAVVRDSQGKVVAASAKPLLGFFPAELGELLALREGLLVAKELSLFIEWVELDAANVVARVFSSCPSSFMDPIVSDIKALFRALPWQNNMEKIGNQTSLSTTLSSGAKQHEWKDGRHYISKISHKHILSETKIAKEMEEATVAAIQESVTRKQPLYKFWLMISHQNKSIHMKENNMQIHKMSSFST
ncbi:hypothetical protein ACOSQ3_006246 [Xanthoceras sorbifolium]